MGDAVAPVPIADDPFSAAVPDLGELAHRGNDVVIPVALPPSALEFVLEGEVHLWLRYLGGRDGQLEDDSVYLL